MSEIQLQLHSLCERGWSIPAIADAIGVSTSAVEKWMAGNRKPRVQKLISAAPV